MKVSKEFKKLVNRASLPKDYKIKAGKLGKTEWRVSGNELKKTCDGFWFKKVKDFVEIAYDPSEWTPVWKGKKFLGYKRKK